MRRRPRREKWRFPRSGANRRMGIGVSNAPDYWPLTIVPSISKPRRLISAWLVIGTVMLLGAALAFALHARKLSIAAP